MSKKTIVMVSVSAAAAVVLGIGLFFGLRYYYDKKAPDFNREHVIYIRPGMSPEEVLDTMGVFAVRQGSLRRTASSEELASRIRPGKYLIRPEHSAVYAVRMLINGWQTPQNLILSGTIRSKERIAQKISRQMMVDSSSVAAALNDEAFLGQYGFTPENVFALFLPDSYQFYWTASVAEIFSRFRKEYDRFWNEERKAAAQEQGLTPMEVSVMASIVSGETLNSAEYKRIAGVYLNRLRRGIRLQADPTICFCFDYELDRVLKKHLSVDSPYNTYKYRGLPPAPINVPPKACIDAVLHPEKHDFIYFCASPEFNGTHIFASSYNAHLNNARAFHRELTRRRKAAAEAAAAQ